MRSDTTPPGERDHAAIWRQTCDRVVELVGSLPDGAGNRQVPTLPSARLIDVLAHLLKVAETVRRRERLDDVALTLPDAADSASASPAELLSAWQSACEAIERSVAGDDAVASALITDISMCEHDIRTAVDRPGARDDISVKVALDELAGRFSDRVATQRIPPLRVTVEQWGTIIGEGHATRCVVADRFEFVRGMAGRRSASEVGRWNWGTDPSDYLPVLAPVPLPIAEVHERDPRLPEHMRDREFVL